MLGLGLRVKGPSPQGRDGGERVRKALHPSKDALLQPFAGPFLKGFEGLGCRVLSFRA